MKFLRTLLAALAVSLGIAAPAHATTYSVDFTDLWYIPAESGWGLNVIQHGNTIFATLFVYANDNSARWYVASDLKPATANAGQAKFTGKLSQTTGPFFGAASFNSSQVVLTDVGNMTLTFLTSTTAILEYNVGTTNVTKNVVRDTLVLDSPAGNYQGGIDAILSACTTSTQNGAIATFLGFLSVGMNSQNGVTMVLNYLVQNSSGTCNFTGTYTQQGRLGSITGGNWVCSVASGGGNTGTFSVRDLDIQVSGMTGTFTAVDQFCSYTGRIGGLRNVGN